MFNFFLQIILMLSLGVMVYLAAKKVPQISDTPEIESHNFFGRFDRLLSALPLEKLDFFVSQLLEKTIRRMKLFLMKMDNYLTRHLEKFKTINHKKKTEKKLALFKGANDNEKVSDNAPENLFSEENENQEKLF